MTVMQQAFNFSGVTEGTAILIVGLLAMLLLAAVQFRNPMAVVVWSVAVLLLVVSGLFGLGSELFWLALLGVVVTLVAGLAVRWSA